MRIDSILYQVIYQKLWEAFKEKEWKENYEPKKYSQKLWTVRNEKKEFVVIEKILKPTGYVDERYFYRRYLDTNPRVTYVGKVDELVICSALEYMGLKVPSGVKNQVHLKTRTVELLKEFVRRFLPDYEINEQKINEMFDSASEGANDGAGKELPLQVTMDIGKVSEQQQAVQTLIHRFYEFVESRCFREAWELLSADFQNRNPWYGDQLKFVEGFINTNGARSVHIFNVSERSPISIEAYVYYIEEIASSTSSDLSSFYSMTVSDLEMFLESVKKIKSRIETAGGKGFEHIEIYKLFEQGVSEYIRYKCCMKPDEISDVFSIRRSIVVNRLYRCCCKWIDNKWCIDSIRGIAVQSAR